MRLTCINHFSLMELVVSSAFLLYRGYWKLNFHVQYPPLSLKVVRGIIREGKTLQRYSSDITFFTFHFADQFVVTPLVLFLYHYQLFYIFSDIFIHYFFFSPVHQNEVEWNSPVCWENVTDNHVLKYHFIPRQFTGGRVSEEQFHFLC